jgi:hypothetical protein
MLGLLRLRSELLPALRRTAAVRSAYKLNANAVSQSVVTEDDAQVVLFVYYWTSHDLRNCQ